MPKLQRIRERIRFSIEKFDGGRNTKLSPSKISPFQSPDQRNTVSDDDGSVATRFGSKDLNTQAIGSSPIDGHTSYNGSMIAWAGGDMFRLSGTTFVTVASAQSQFVSGTKVAFQEYQGILFSSDGTNGPWRYESPTDFYNMGIVQPSAATASGTSAGSVGSGTYFHTISFVNSHAVEGAVGSVSAGVTLTTTSTIGVTDIPVGSSLAGVEKRRVYRSTDASGPFRRVGEISDNVTTTFVDTVSNEEEGVLAVEDGTQPTVFNIIELHSERLFFDDAFNKSLLRFTNFTNPFISIAENFEPINNNDGEDLIGLASQLGVITIWKESNNFAIITPDSSDTLTWSLNISPSNLGIVGPRAFAKTENGIIFVGKQNGRLSGFHLLSGINVIVVSDGVLKTRSISENIEPDIVKSSVRAQWPEIVLSVFQNRLFAALATGSETTNKTMYWFDLNRIVGGNFDSWHRWSGLNLNTFTEHEGDFYGGSSASDGRVIQLEITNRFNDSDVAIDSYWWTKEVGGEKEGILDSYIKDFRELFVWHTKLGAFAMNVRWRVDGDAGSGQAQMIDLDPGGTLWGPGMTWGTSLWGGALSDVDVRIPIGRLRGKRIQVRFDNQNKVDQGFKVHRLEIGMNLRRPR